MQARLSKLIIAIAATTMLGACDNDNAQADRIQYFDAPSTAGLQLPFSASVRVGDMLYLSGNIGNLPGTLNLAPGGMAGESRQTMENIRGAVEAAGASMDQVIKCTVFIVDMSQWGAFNEIYVEYFKRPPARSAVGANALALGAEIEVECIAAL